MANTKKIYMVLTTSRWENGSGWSYSDDVLEFEDRTSQSMESILDEIKSGNESTATCWSYWSDYFSNFDYVDLDECIDEDGDWIKSTTDCYTVSFYLVDEENKNEYKNEEYSVLIGEYSFSDEDFGKYLWNQEHKEGEE